MPFGYREVTLNHWPYNQICIGCKFDRLVLPKDNENDENNEEFFGRGSICMRSMPADACVRNDFSLSEEAQYQEMEKHDLERGEIE